MSCILIKNATIVNEGTISKKDILIRDELISAIGVSENWKIPAGTIIIEAAGLICYPE